MKFESVRDLANHCILDAEKLGACVIHIERHSVPVNLVPVYNTDKFRLLDNGVPIEFDMSREVMARWLESNLKKSVYRRLGKLK